MKKFRVIIHYEGAFDYDIEANTKEEAEEEAWKYYFEAGCREFEDNICDSEVCDNYEIDY